MAQAQYEILIPQNPHSPYAGQDIAGTALDHYGQHFSPEDTAAQYGGHLERNRELLVNGERQLCDVVHLQAEDGPYTDSFIKQLAKYIGEVVAMPTITVSKSSKSGINVWTVRT